MKQVLDMVPLAAMLVAYLVTRDIYAATIALMISLPVIALYYRVRDGKWHFLHAFGALLVLPLGGLTLYFHQDSFIKAKPTVLFTGMGVAFLVSQVASKTVLVKRMLGTAMQLPDALWRKINVAWALFYFALAGLNWYIASNFDNDTWVSFKTWGIMLLNLVFMLGHAPFVARYLQEPPPASPSTPKTT